MASSAERTIYTWDAADKLTGLSQSEGGQTVTASFQYDLFGRRISSSIQQGGNAAQTVHYLYEGQQALGEVRNQLLSHRLITGLSLDETIARIAMVGTGNINTQASRQMLTDALNSVIAQANGQGTGIANSYGYSPYGQTQTVGPDATGNTAQYTSRENDGATGLTFYRARYYDPVLKRFISEDPIGLEGGDNVFAYVGGDPVVYSDPTGNYGLVGALGAAGFNLALQVGGAMFQGADFMTALNCVNVVDVVISGAMGAIGPSFISQIIRRQPGDFARKAGLGWGYEYFQYFGRAQPAGFAIKKAMPNMRFGGDECECSKYTIGGALGELLH